MQEERRVTKVNPFDDVFFLTRWFNLWLVPLFNAGWRRTLVLEDLYACTRGCDPEALGDKLEV